ncbi:AAA family ATPase [Methylobacterium sp. E-045]|uniref:AAA family ATPase n=1 Tax=Methylobacterium sp. E-045 TaxID=2836575 RepID=UPI001FBAF382|nr:AAA family ATPase [Methylobacterium sp. E-045]MCJ2128345.1 ATP-binding protein [Methylobacterium sp. E-045]
MTFTFAPAVREQVSLLIGLAGASGSGKTKSALRMAEGISPAGRIAFIDSEARRGLHYADAHRFQHADMRPPFAPSRWIEGIHAAEATGAEVVILDSFSHEYDGEGGIVDWADRLAEGTPKPGIEHPRKKGDHQDWWKDWAEKPVDSPGNWKAPKLAHKRMMNAILQCRATLIFCLRADEKIKIAKDNRGKTVVEQLGWMPICEKRFMYDMTASFTLSPDSPGLPRFDLPHKLQEQHRSFFPQGRPIDEDCGRRLAAWAKGGAAPASDQSTRQPSNRDRLFAAAREKAEEGSFALNQWKADLQDKARQALDEIEDELDATATTADESFPGDQSEAA